jgi:transcriptional regulator with XRE-family HTH domain
MAHRRMPPASAPKRIPEKQAMGLALRKLRKKRNLTQAQAAERANMVDATWRRHELGQRDTSIEQIITMAVAIGFTSDDLLEEFAELSGSPQRTLHMAPAALFPTTTKAPQGIELPVRDRVQAGAWLAADDFSQIPVRYVSAIKDPRYAHADQWLCEVLGDSVNQLYIFEGDFIHCVDTIAIGYTPKTGDIVEVERLRFGGQERELTVKQIEITPDGVVELWPRSTNTRWIEPLTLSDGTAEGETVEVRIRGLVISSIRRFP